MCEELGAWSAEKTFCAPDVASTSEVQGEIKTSTGGINLLLLAEFCHLIPSDILKANWTAIAQSV